jgi:hypothetical protein
MAEGGSNGRLKATLIGAGLTAVMAVVGFLVYTQSSTAAGLAELRVDSCAGRAAHEVRLEHLECALARLDRRFDAVDSKLDVLIGLGGGGAGGRPTRAAARGGGGAPPGR